MMNIRNNKLYIQNTSIIDLIKKHGSPLYIYNSEKIRQQYRKLVENITYSNIQINYACKANTSTRVLELLREEGANIECISIGEIEAARQAGFTTEQIIFTCSNLTEEEIRYLIKNNITANLDSFHQIETWGKLNPGSDISVRINQGIGAGHHDHVITGGPDSKFGIYHTRIDEIKTLKKQFNLNIIGIQQHIGSNVLDENIFIKAIKALLETATQFENLEYIDFGGGFGIPYKPDEKEFDMQSLGKRITKMLNNFSRDYRKNIKVIFEPGRYLVAQAGYLLAEVIDIKRTPFKTFVGLNTGFNHLVRPAMYGSYHPIANASRVEGEKETVTIAGNICESGDLFAQDRELTKFEIGDIAAILNAGAYGYTMASRYNSRELPKEIII
jgi:diaminopimelate decarboxylase